MFCANCGTNVPPTARFCVQCGQVVEKPLNQAQCSSTESISVKSFADFQKNKGKEWKERVSKKGKSVKGKKDDKKGTNDEKEVIIFIGLVEWSESSEYLKRKHGKRMALKVRKDDPPAVLLNKALEKWKAYFSNCYDGGEDYVLLLEDFKEATFLPGSSKEFFTLDRYREELGKDFKRITLFLCTLSDFRLSEGGVAADGEKPDGSLWDESIDLPDAVNGDGDNLPESSKEVLDVDKQDQEQGHEIAGELQSQELQIQDDFEIAQAIQASFDNDLQGSNQEEMPVEGAVDSAAFSDYTSVVQSLEKHVIASEQFFLVVRRGIPFQRAISLWQRESKRNSPKNRVTVKYLGEEGIDSGALAREYFSDTITQIGSTLFPGGSPVESTLFVRNETFRTAGEIVATSLAQNGPPPNFLNAVTFDSLINLNMDIRALSPEKHLTSEQQKLFDTIREDVGNHQDLIIEHGYTGVINEEHIDDILGSVLVSIWHKRVLCLNEFRQGMDLYGLSSILSQSPDACKPLFIKGHISDVDANYLAGALNPRYSPEGSSRRLVEEKIVDHFQDFLLSLEDDNITGYSAPIAWNYEDGLLQDRAEIPEEPSEMEKFQTPELNAAGVMGWLTGQRHREVNGTKVQIAINFDHDCKIRAPNHTVCFPYVGACGMEITLPIEHMNTYEDFRHVFTLAYCKGQAFAKP
ncbi:hypothetical protein ACROYT_G000087 [Oculina patagonica]